MTDNGLGYDKTLLTDLVKTKMPYGKYKGTLISDLPAYYLEWFSTKGFPKGRIGQLLETCFDIKVNGLGFILDEIKKLSK